MNQEIAQLQPFDWTQFDFEKRTIPPPSLVIEQALARITPERKIIEGPEGKTFEREIAQEPIDLNALNKQEHIKHLIHTADRIHFATIRLLAPHHRKSAYLWLSKLAYEISPYAHDAGFLEEASVWAKVEPDEHDVMLAPALKYRKAKNIPIDEPLS